MSSRLLGLFKNGAGGMGDFLSQIPDLGPASDVNRTLIRFKLSGEDLEQGRLACAIPPHERQLLPALQPKGHAAQNLVHAESLVDVGDVEKHSEECTGSVRVWKCVGVSVFP